MRTHFFQLLKNVAVNDQSTISTIPQLIPFHQCSKKKKNNKRKEDGSFFCFSFGYQNCNF